MNKQIRWWNQVCISLQTFFLHPLVIWRQNMHGYGRRINRHYPDDAAKPDVPPGCKWHSRGHDEGPVKHFTEGLWAHDWNLVEILFVTISILMGWSCHNFAHATTAQLLWHVQNCDLIGPLYFLHKSYVFSQDLDCELINPLRNGSEVSRSNTE